MSDECLFCKIINKDIPAEIVYENEKVIAFKDINPCAPVHLLFIHKSHTENFAEMVRRDVRKVTDVLSAITEYCEESGLEKSGYRVVTNVGSDSGQIVLHTHFHVLGGHALSGKFGV